MCDPACVADRQIACHFRVASELKVFDGACEIASLRQTHILTMRGDEIMTFAWSDGGVVVACQQLRQRVLLCRQQLVAQGVGWFPFLGFLEHATHR